MSTIEALIIGLLQGLAEFLPISSSGHIKLAKLIMGIESSESQVLFDLVCHLGTLVAVLFFFRREILLLFTEKRKKLLLLCLATLPLLPCYLLLKPLRDFASAPQFLGTCLMITGGILFLGQRWRIKRVIPSLPKYEIWDALWIGTMQATALIPGISRSASTISCAQVLGWEPDEAVRFSFLLSIPTIIGGNCLELLKLYLSADVPPSFSLSTCAIGFITSCIGGLVIIRYALAFLQKGNLRPFAWYCLIIGMGITLYVNFFLR